MNYSNYCAAEKLLREYYENKQKIRFKENYLKELERDLTVIQDKLINTNIVLNTDLSSVNYAEISVKCGQLSCSDMEKQIENIFSRLEKEKEHIENEIIIVNTEILILNNKNRSMESIINLLSDENRKLIELRFANKLSFERISNILHMSRTGVRRKIDFIFLDILKFSRYLDLTYP